jgi:hypothetical protein
MIPINTSIIDPSFDNSFFDNLDSFDPLAFDNLDLFGPPVFDNPLPSESPNFRKRSSADDEGSRPKKTRKLHQVFTTMFEKKNLKLKETSASFDNSLFPNKFTEIYNKSNTTNKKYLLNLILEKIIKTFQNKCSTKRQASLTKLNLLNLNPENNRLIIEDNALRLQKIPNIKNHAEEKHLPGTKIQYETKPGNIYYISELVNKLFENTEFSKFKKDNKELFNNFANWKVIAGHLKKFNQDRLIDFVKHLYSLQNALVDYPCSSQIIDSPEIIDLDLD